MLERIGLSIEHFIFDLDLFNFLPEIEAYSEFTVLLQTLAGVIIMPEHIGCKRRVFVVKFQRVIWVEL